VLLRQLVCRLPPPGVDPVVVAVRLRAMALELVVLAYLRWRFFEDTFARALGIVTFAGIIIAAVSAGLGSALGNSGV